MFRACQAVTQGIAALIADGLADPETTWSLGGFGALAEFARSADEPVTWLSPRAWAS